MKKMCWVGVLVLGLLLSWSVVMAEDGFYVIPVKKQATSWDKTIAGSARWTLVLENEAALDKETGLVWQRNTDDTIRDYYVAETYCYGLNLGGRMGWRMPTMEELTSLVDRSQINPALPTGHPFTNPRSSSYWSSSTHAGYPDYAWHVHFDNGDVNWHHKSTNYYVRCVRAGS